MHDSWYFFLCVQIRNSTPVKHTLKRRSLKDVNNLPVGDLNYLSIYMRWFCGYNLLNRTVTERMLKQKPQLVILPDRIMAAFAKTHLLQF